MLQDYLHPSSDRQGDFVAAGEEHFGQPESGANESAWADTNADMSDRSDKYACAGGFSYGKHVRIDLVDRFNSAFVVDGAIPV